MIKKIASASLFASFLMTAATFPAMAQVTTTATSTTAPKTVDVACVKLAIDKRDNTLSAAVDTYAIAVKTALSTRQTVLKAAWDITGKDRRQALRTAWRNYRDAAKKARKALQDSRRDAWKQFNTDRKACNAKEEEPGGGQGADAQL